MGQPKLAATTAPPAGGNGADPLADDTRFCLYCQAEILRRTYSRGQYRILRFCSVSHCGQYHSGRRKNIPLIPSGIRAAPSRTFNRIKEPRLPIPRFRRGIRQEERACPKCGGFLLDEPGMKHCRNCGKVWPIQGANYALQESYEVYSGLQDVMPNHRG